jgi:glutaminyl-peptide cyclotransferase
MACKKILIPVFIVVSCLISCTNPKPEPTSNLKPETLNPKLSAPHFNADSAYRFTKEQVDFGPRVPGSKAHELCGKYLEEKLKSYGLDVIVQKDVVTTYDDKKYTMSNYIGQYNLKNSKRILLSGHWDTRPFADQDSLNPTKPFDGADDGASCVAVLLEIARQLFISKPNIGVDIVFFDMEDYGDQSRNNADTWCLGSQYWGKHPHKPDYFAQFGILLDMVGGKNPVFPREGSSMKYASSIVDEVWNIAARAGYKQYFTDEITGETTDDHVYINQLTNIPTIDIVDYDADRHDYKPWHHKHSDNMEIIDAATLKMVGQVVLEVVFSEVNSPK